MGSDASKKSASSPHREVGLPVRIGFSIFTVLTVVLAVDYFFSLQILGFPIPQWQYFFLLIALLLPFVFVYYPASESQRDKIYWYDWLAAGLAFGIPFYFQFFIKEMEMGFWAMSPEPLNLILAVILTLLVLEGARRSAGVIFALVCIIVGAIPLLSPILPEVLQGPPITFASLMGHITFAGDGYAGIPMIVFGGILVGFLLFAGLLVGTGAGDFFIDLATSLAGTQRGGMAKVAIIASGFFGSLSGSPLANIASTGSITIPAMKKHNYPPFYAASVEACASTGGILMPPVMGAAAFIMASMTQVPYANIMIAAIVPSVLFYFGLYIQIDGFAAKTRMRGLTKEECPSLRDTFVKGWHFLFVIVFLVWGLVYMRWEALAPFYASLVLFVIAMTRKNTRVSPAKLFAILGIVGKLFISTLAVILPIGIIVAGVSITGVASAFTAGILKLSGGVPFVALLLGAIACYVLGMAGMLNATYIFLAISFAPAMVLAGFEIMSVHLFIIYYAMISMITPPVATGAFLAASMAGAPPMKTAFTSMRLGVVIYFIPFFFIYEPSMVFVGSLLDSAIHISTAVAGVFVLASALEGYMIGLGILKWTMRLPLAIFGLFLAVPSILFVIIGLCGVFAFVGGYYVLSLRKKQKALTGNQ